ncbi:AMP-binding protein [Streptomyces chitinivorans]
MSALLAPGRADTPRHGPTADWIPVARVFPIHVPPSWARHEHYARRVLHTLSRNPDRVVLRWRGESLTGAGLAARVHAAARTLDALGTGRGDTVAVLTRTNHPAMLVARHAAHLLGAAVVYIRSHNPRSDAVELPAAVQAEMLRECGARFLVCDGTHLPRARELARDPGGRPLLVGADAGAADLAARLDAPPEPRTPAAVEEVPPHAPYEPDDRAVVAHTSGSTGRPKSIGQSFRTWNSLVDVFPGSPEPGRPSRFLAVLPLSHTIGSMVDAVLAEGGRVVLHEGFDADAVLEALAAEGVTDTYLAVPHLYRLTESARSGGADLPSLRRLVYSGTPASPRRIAEARGVLGDRLVQLYGSTEAGGISNLTPLDHCEPELLPTVGRPFPWVSVRIVDPGTGREVPRGRTGEVCVASPTVMDGYLGAPGTTAPVLRDGLLRTGDLGLIDRYGYLRLAGRVGDVVKSGGLKIHPAAVERALLSHPDVANAAVYGVADDDRVERVHAAVSLRAGARRDPGALREHVAGLLTPEHAPAELAFWDDLPLTAHGKPDKAYLRTLAGREDRLPLR